MKLFLDANVLFTAAHNPEGKAALVIELAGEGVWEVVSSGLAIEEARRNLEIKFPENVRRLEALTQRVGVVSTVLEGDSPVELPPKDKPILLSALAADCSHLLTGDLRHFGAFMNQPRKTRGIVVQTVGDFLDALAGGTGRTARS